MGLKPIVTLAGGGKGAADQRQTTCSVCGYGIYEGQKRVWSRKPLGLVHAECTPQEANHG